MTTTVPAQFSGDFDDQGNAERAAFERIPPQDLTAEQSVLGAMMLSKDAITDAIEILKAKHFYKPAHETIYGVICDLDTADEPVDPITVCTELTKRGELARVGGPGYVHSLVHVVPTAANAAYYADTVYEKAMLRGLVQAGTRITQLGHAGQGDLEEIQDAAAAEFNAAIAQRADSETLAIGADADVLTDAIEALQRGEKKTGIPTGFTDFDRLTSGGLMPGQMVIIAARPAVGKSTLALDIARHAAFKHNRTVAFFTLEMPRQELQMRCLSAEARIALHHIKTESGMTGDDWNRLARAMDAFREAQLLIDEVPEASVTSIKAKCRRIQQRQGLDLIVIDYLQLLRPARSRAESRQVEVSEMSRAIKLMAKELGVPVVVLAQLNRGPEQRTDKTPMISDLRESGSLEQDADIVILLNREDAYDKESARSGETDLIVAKHRGGSTSKITVASQLHYCRFVNMEGGF